VGLALAAVNVPITMLSLGSSGLNVSVAVDDEHAGVVVRALHDALFAETIEVSR
jgi:aspartokinase